VGIIAWRKANAGSAHEATEQINQSKDSKRERIDSIVAEQVEHGQKTVTRDRWFEKISVKKNCVNKFLQPSNS
jgi:hypothetical protein